MVSTEALEKLLGEIHKDYSRKVETDIAAHKHEVEMLQGKIERFEYQNILNIERLEKYAKKEEIERQEKDTEIAVC